MSFIQDINLHFRDADSLVSPRPCSPDTHNASNNGCLYLSEVMVLLTLRGEVTLVDRLDYLHTLAACSAAPGCLSRSPTNKTDFEGPDDYYALCASLFLNELFTTGNKYLKYGFNLKAPGCYNNINLGKFSWSTCLWRQPQLLALFIWASGKTVWFPLNLYTAVVIAISGMGMDQTGGADSWRLNWLLTQVATRKSWLCKMAAALWWKRLFKVWGPTGMQAVYGNYYQGLPGKNHPLTDAIGTGEFK